MYKLYQRGNKSIAWVTYKDGFMETLIINKGVVSECFVNEETKKVNEIRRIAGGFELKTVMGGMNYQDVKNLRKRDI